MLHGRRISVAPRAFPITRCVLFSVAFALALESTSRGEDTVSEPDFVKEAIPFLQQHCFDCHSGERPEAAVGFDKFFNVSSVVKQRKMWERAFEQVSSGVMPPKDHPQPDPAAVEAFTKHLKSVFEYADKTAKPDPGRVTMRRMNRFEYRNTIQDWIGVDFDPTSDFPSDDIGHGFDNIGDVLTLSPVLMERYLAAAEGIAERAMPSQLPPPNKRHIRSVFTEPGSAAPPMEGDFRLMRSDSEEHVALGPVNVPIEWENDGEYIFRTRMYAPADSAEGVEVAILLHGEKLAEADSDEQLNQFVGSVIRPAKTVQRIALTGRSADKADYVEVKLPPLAGRQRISVALVKPKEGQGPVKAAVEYLAIEGPMDTRPESLRRLLAYPSDTAPENRAGVVVRRWLRTAYRRPPTEDEVQRVVDLVNRAQNSGETWEASMQLALQAILCSPKFLFRVELDDRPTSPEHRELDQYQLASRLSYFLWGTMPDEQSSRLADEGKLLEQLDSEINRMLKSEKASALVDQFGLQWLQIKRLETFAPDAEKFPTFNDRLRRAMLEETRQFLIYILKEDRSILDLIDANYTFLNESLANHYGIADTNGNASLENPTEPKGEPIKGRSFRKVNLRADSARGGLLTQASVLAVTSNPTRTSPVKRGRWVLEQILGTPPPPPPPNVPELEANNGGVATGSLRQRMEQHRENPSCANCHAKMDPLGFALENYDAIGRFREKDGEFPIDPAGQLPDGSTFQGMKDLKQILKARSDDVTRCLVEKMLTYALGRGLEYYDRPVVDRIVQATKNEEYRISAMIRAIVHSEPFRYRRALEAE